MLMAMVIIMDLPSRTLSRPTSRLQRDKLGGRERDRKMKGLGVGEGGKGRDDLGY
jgi:hypothetical protein